ncbi:hypothetical protein STAS_02343 [Striga asiatica]|uniref:PTC1-like winged helix-turn-helix domain-containing protein n=1 Tax=Striga asiatica TaxID=4170 RepID=A0A5A7P1J6_STRAF|nr:hypothetical protein STAS_02343 [Striga asiatica]
MNGLQTQIIPYDWMDLTYSRIFLFHIAVVCLSTLYYILSLSHSFLLKSNFHFHFFTLSPVQFFSPLRRPLLLSSPTTHSPALLLSLLLSAPDTPALLRRLPQPLIASQEFSRTQLEIEAGAGMRSRLTADGWSRVDHRLSKHLSFNGMDLRVDKEVDLKECHNQSSVNIAHWTVDVEWLAQKNLLSLMKAKGETTRKPIMRPQLRAEARKKRRDTGLLNHLLNQIYQEDKDTDYIESQKQNRVEQMMLTKIARRLCLQII